MTYWVEIRATVQRRAVPRLVPIEDVANHVGFRSVFAFDDALAARIRERGTMTELRGESVYADTLFMDFDGHDPVAFRAWLRERSGLAWQEYDSGNRSAHFHIPIAPVCAVWLPAAMKAWTHQHAPTADTSFLHPAGQYRLPGTYHWKQPGRRKELVAEGAGVPLVLRAPAPELLVPRLQLEDIGREDFFEMLLVHRGEGKRRPWLWQAATKGAQAGIEFDEVYEALLGWNARLCDPPHDEATVMRQCESAFRQLQQKGGL